MAFCEFQNARMDGNDFLADLTLNASGGGRYLFKCRFDVRDHGLNLPEGRRADGTAPMDGELRSIIRFHIFFIIDAIQDYIREHSDTDAMQTSGR